MMKNRTSLTVIQAVNSSSRTIGEIVAADFRTAMVFESYSIDFCCGGKATLDRPV